MTSLMYKCENCGREFTTKSGLGYHKNYCGKNNIFYDGGYKCKIGPDGNRVYIHREIMEQKLGRKLRPDEIVHHKDENKLNNDPDNLKVTNLSKHMKHHYNNIAPKSTGSDHPNSKLNEEQVVQIKLELKSLNRTLVEVAKEYGVDESVIRSIRNNSTWSHVRV